MRRLCVAAVLFVFVCMATSPVMAQRASRQEHISHLIGRLGSDDLAVRDEAIEELVDIGRPAVGQLIGSLRDYDTRVVAGAAEALGEMRATDAARPMAQLLADEYAWYPAVNYLNRLGDAGLVAATDMFLHPPNERAQQHAALALGRFGLEGFQVLLVEGLLRSGDADTRASACRGLELGISAKGPNVLPDDFVATAERELSRALLDDTLEVRVWAVRALGELQEPRSVGPVLEAVEYFRELLADEYVVGGERAQAEWGLQGALTALGQIGGREALDVLIGHLDSDDADVVTWAAYGLGYLGSPEAIPALRDCIMSASDRWARQASCRALTRIGGPEALEILTIVAEGDPHEAVRKAAADGVRRLNAEQDQ